MKVKYLIVLLITLFLFNTNSFSQIIQETIKEADSMLINGDHEKANQLIASAIENEKITQSNLPIYFIYAEALINLGDLEKATEITDKLIKKENLLNTYQHAQLYNLTGFLQLQKGRLDLAGEQLEKAQEFSNDVVNTSKLKASIYNNLGLYYWNTGNTNRSDEYLKQALAIRTELYGKNHYQVAAVYNNLGLIRSIDNPEQALGHYNTALEIYKQIFPDEHLATSITNNNIALLLLESGKLNEAESKLDEVWESWSEIYGTGSAKEAFLFSNFARIYIKKEQYDLARTYLNDALKIYKDKYGDKHPEIATIYNLKASINVQKGEFEPALKNYQNALITNSRNFSSNDLWKNPKANDYYNADIFLNTLFLKSKALEAHYYNKTIKFKDLQASLHTLMTCDTLIENIRHLRISKEDKIALGTLASKIYEQAMQVSLEISEVAWKKSRYRKKAFYFCEKSKAAVLLDAISDAKAIKFAGIPDQLLEKEKLLKSEISYLTQKLAESAGTDKEEEYRKLLFRQKMNYQDFTGNLEKNYPQYYNLKFNNQVVQVEDLQSSLDDETCILSYFIAEEAQRIYVLLVTNNKYKVESEPIPDDFDKSIIALRNLIYYNVDDKAAEYSYELYEKLFPLRIPSSINKLVVIPEGRLGTVPFEALNTDKRNVEYLIEEFEISYSFSSTLYYQNNIKEKEHQLQENNIALFAPVNFKSTHEKFTVPSLPWTKSEVQKIDELFEAKGYQTKTFIDNEASEEKIKSNTDTSTQSQFLHLATHGIIDEQLPELSGVMLYDTNNNNEDDFLYSGEIYNLDLNCDLVTLSACQTGLGKIARGEGIIGLSRALLYAGAQNLVVSLWNVADNSTAELMIDFYSNYFDGSNQKAEYSSALRQAKLKMLKSEEYSSPYFWAPFVLIGD